jgi:uracil phosphoribosyltransferase
MQESQSVTRIQSRTDGSYAVVVFRSGDHLVMRARECVGDSSHVVLCFTRDELLKMISTLDGEG